MVSWLPDSVCANFCGLTPSDETPNEKKRMSMKPTTKEDSSSSPKPIPEGMHTVTPHLICAGAADAIEFYRKAFGAVELSRMPGSDGKLMHASIQIGDSVVMLNEENPNWGSFGPKFLKGSPVTIHLYVENADAVFEQAVRAGAKITMPLDDMFWGDRYGKLEDPFGHHWSIGTHVRDVSPDEMQKVMEQMDS
jgi:PhnB protein